MVFQNNLLAGASGTTGTAAFDTTLISNSVWMDGSADGFTRAASDFDNEDGKEFTLGTWFQLTEFGASGALFCAGTSGGYTSLRHNSDNKIYFQTQAGDAILSTPNLYRDIGWYHLLLSVDTTQAASSNRVRLFINGEEVIFSGTQPAQNRVYQFNTNQIHEVGDSYENGAFEGYLAQSFMIGSKSIQQGDFSITDFLDTFTFGTNGSQFIPKAHSEIKTLVDNGSDNSFLLTFENAALTKIDDSGSTKSGNMTANGGLAAIFDGDTTKNNSQVGSGANTSSNDSFVAVDHGSAKTVTQFIAYGSSDAEGLDGDSGGSTLTFTLVGSTDNFSSSNVTLFNGTVSDPGAGGTHTVSSGITVGAFRYHKMTLQTNTTNSGEQFGQFAELEYYEGNGLGTDSSTNGNHFTFTSMNSANQSVNTPSKVYSVFNPLAHADNSYPGTFTLSEGSQKNVINSSNTSVKTTVPFIMSGSDIIRAQFTFSTIGDGGCGITGSSHTAGTYHTASNSVAGRGEVGLCGSGALVVDGNFNNSYTSALSNGDVVDVIVNLDVGAVYFAVNGSLLGGATQAEIQAGTTTNAALVSSFVRRTAGEVFNFYAFQYNPTSSTIEYNSGQSSFTHSYSSITSLTSLNTADLPAPDYQGIDYFDATIYEGNGTGQKVGDFVPFTDAYTVDKSAMFEEADKRYLSFTPSAGGDQKTFTFSTWFKLAADASSQRNCFLSVDDGSKEAQILLMGDQSEKDINVNMYNGSSFVLNLNTDRAFLDESQWNHLVVAIDTRSAVASANKVKIYINGVQQSTNGTQLSTDDYETEFNSENEHNIGRQTNNGIGEPSWYLAETVMVEGSQLDPTSFGQVDTSTNRWVPKDVSGLTFGDEGWYLEYEGTFNSGVAATGAGKDSSGNGNHWAEQNDSGSAWATSDQFADTPSKNFNVFDGGLNGAGTLSEGNTQIVTTTNSRTTYTTMNIPATGKWYWEVDVVNYNTGGSVYFGIVEFDELVTGNDPINGLTKQVIFDNYAGNAYIYSTSSLGTTWCNTPGNDNFNADGDILQFALDQDAGTLFIGNNNTWFRAGGARDSFANATTVGQRTFKTGVKRRFLIGRGGSSNETYALNFGPQANTFSGSSTTFNAAADGFFVYTPPTGYKALNQDNLDDTASKITAWSWIKNRDATDSHMLIDRVRGVGVEVHTDGTTTTPETTNANTVQRFLQRGVQVGNDVQVNTANESYVLWQWLVGDSATTGSSIGAGSISTGVPSLASTALAADAGHFSVVSWTGNETAGATVGHGLGGTPDFIMAIARAESGENKPVYHTFMTADTDHLKINEGNGQSTAGTTIWDESAMSSTLIGLGAAVQSNSNNGMIAYCFRSVPGVCKVGTYTGNGDGTGSDTVDGPYVSCGFKPRWIMFKWVSGGSLSGEGWVIKDTARQTFNPNDDADIYANTTTAENAGATHGADILSDGFKIRGGGGAVNKLGAKYLYVAMADISGNGTLPPIYGR